MKSKYEQAMGLKLIQEKYIKELTEDVDDNFKYVNHMMEEMKRCESRLKKIALTHDPLNNVDHIQLMIEAEEMEKQSGFRQRIKKLQEFQRMACVDEQFQAFEQNFMLTKNAVTSVGSGANK